MQGGAFFVELPKADLLRAVSHPSIHSGGRNKGAIDHGLGRNRDFGLLGKEGVAFGNADPERANFL